MGAVIAPATHVAEVTLSLDTSAYVSGDVLADTQEIEDVFRRNGGSATLHSVVLLDEDDQAQALDLIFLSADNSIGTENAAVSITDANARAIIGIVELATGDYVDMVNSQVAIKTDIGLVMKAGSSSTSLFIAAVSRGTGTYTASGIRVKLGFTLGA